MTERRFGLLDVQDNVWLGNDAGPWTDTRAEIAALARYYHAEALGWSPLRIEVRQFSETVTKKRDEVPLQWTMADAIKRAEGEHVPRKRRLHA